MRGVGVVFKSFERASFEIENIRFLCSFTAVMDAVNISMNGNTAFYAKKQAGKKTLGITPRTRHHISIPRASHRG